MDDQLQYQIRIYLNDFFAEKARRDAGDPALKPLADVLAKHNTALKSVFDAFSDYVAEAEEHGIDKFRSINGRRRPSRIRPRRPSTRRSSPSMSMAMRSTPRNSRMRLRPICSLSPGEKSSRA